MKSRPLLILLSALCLLSGRVSAVESKLIHLGDNGRLSYNAWNPEGDTLLDFSNCGYAGGGAEIPTIAVKVTLAPDAKSADDTARIQGAVDELARLPQGPDGFRGALALARGTYRIKGTINLRVSGIVVRGEGSGTDVTVIIATGKVQRALFEVKGSAGPKAIAGTAQPINDRYVPAGGRTFSVKDASGFKVGDTVFVRRHGNAAWIHTIGMDAIKPRESAPSQTKNWQPFDLAFDRVITAIEQNRITVDAPIACAIDQRWGGGDIAKYSDAGRIEHVGIENLRADSEFNRQVTKSEPGKDKSAAAVTYFADEEHALRLVTFNNVKNGWARDVVAVHFYHGVSDLAGGAKWITVQDSASIDPVSVITGGRRYPFAIEGQLNLVQRCYSRDARHAFVFGSRVPGPNAFLFCKSERDHATSEPHHRWSCGGLYDNVQAEIAFQDRQWMGSGHGWAGANYVAWNTEGTLICQQPPTAQNFAIGHLGKQLPGAFERAAGYWESHGAHVTPRSLYLKQLEDRLGTAAVRQVGYIDTDGMTKS